MMVVKSKLGVLPPELFENDLQPVDYRKVDSRYSPEQLARLKQIEDRVAKNKKDAQVQLKPK